MVVALNVLLILGAAATQNALEQGTPLVWQDVYKTALTVFGDNFPTASAAVITQVGEQKSGSRAHSERRKRPSSQYFRICSQCEKGLAWPVMADVCFCRNIPGSAYEDPAYWDAKRCMKHHPLVSCAAWP